VANVSHELRTPLTSVVGYAETLLDGALEEEERRRDFVQVIHEQGMRLQSLVTDLLALADLERPDLRLRYESIDLRDLIESQVDAMRERATRAGLSLRMETGPSVEMDADPTRVAQVLVNLLDNALGYTERGGVTVAWGADDASAWVTVADTGPGIAEADRGRIFERFYRVDKARTGRAGTGLGLAIVHHLVTLHGGTITLDSQVGRGSTFRVVLPRRAAPTEQEQETA
jgi:two-component system phosphate regulon sensor histidine kinase PhoR